jgi:glycosyltransferase XagB
VNAPHDGGTLQRDALPASIAFLASTTIAQARIEPDVLFWAEQESRRIGVCPDEVLIKSGLISERSFYRALALWLGLAFAESIRAMPLPASAGQDEIVRCANAGFVRLRRDRLASAAGRAPAPVFALAPYGNSLKRIMTLDLGERADLVVTTPTALLVGLRHANANWIQAQASRSVADLSAAQGLSAGQFVFAAVCAAVIPFAATLDLERTLVVLALLAGPLFVMLIALRLSASLVSTGLTSAGIDFAIALPSPDDRDLPVYTVIIPLYRERQVLPRLLDAIDGLDYPKAKLDVKIVVEADDVETRAALAIMSHAAFIDVVVVPRGQPRTKPRALNAALLEAKGTLLTIFDAEDVPDPLQLRKAAALFKTSDPDVMCLQAHLVIDNLADNWISRCFALEYAALFDVINPGLLAADLPILLGGTSNHFLTERLIGIGGWDAWNVTEDADLSFRMARGGYRTAELPSWTLEEAPSDAGIWMRQRTRWLKGYMQTIATHSRNPVRLVREAGLGDALTLQALALATVVSSLGYPFFLVAVLYALLEGGFLQSGNLPDMVLKTLAMVLFGSGLFSMIIPAMLGAHRRKVRSLWLMVPLLPLYYLLVSVAAWRALYELVVAPFHWHKTDHGLARSSHYAAGTRGEERARAPD